ncbi:hypothetical protein, partial [Oerskovia sp. Root22]|uniref:hypothetical protein n=1 Tax=Oerskovia sp. Root22 TaxID=1736494 RepID=UPI001F3FE360
MTVTVEMDEATIDPGQLQCPAPGSGENGGLANSTTLTHNGETTGDDVCATLPLIDVTKTVSAGPTPNGDGTWTITYDLVASNTGAATGTYDIADQLHYGEGILVGSASILTAPAGVTVNSGWTGQGADGAPENVVASGIALGAGASHTYKVQVVVSLDQAVVTPETLQCPAPGSGENGGLANSTTLTHNGTVAQDDACASLPLIDVTKTVSAGPTPNGDGIALGAGASHTYKVQVVVSLDQAVVTPETLQCPAPGSGENGGLANSTTLTHNGTVAQDDACASLPLIDVTKTVSAGPTPNGDGTWTVTYDVVATNTGAAQGTYDVSDRMTADGDLEVRSGAVTT